MADESKAVGSVAAPITLPQEAVFWQALGNPTVPKIYANTFGVIVHPTDLAITFGQAGMIAGVVSLNYSVAKTFVLRLQQAIASYEATAEINVPSADEIEKRLRAKDAKT